MKAQNITIDINRLSTEELEQLTKMLYYTLGDMDTCKTVNDRIAFNNGWMSEKKAEEYINKYC